MLQFFEDSNLEGHLNFITGSRVTALNGWILPIGGASAVEGLQSTGPSCLLFISDNEKVDH